jgi:2-methylisocitrate lyase-like PEP mutase family enzyme
MTQAEKGAAFRARHERDTAFIIPNPWDVGSTGVLEHMGFEAPATTSLGYAQGSFTFAADAAGPRDIDQAFP